jgi:hypothetical protein
MMRWHLAAHYMSAYVVSTLVASSASFNALILAALALAALVLTALALQNKSAQGGKQHKTSQERHFHPPSSLLTPPVPPPPPPSPCNRPYGCVGISSRPSITGSSSDNNAEVRVALHNRSIITLQLAVCHDNNGRTLLPTESNQINSLIV